jgi:hypothetical protein
MLLDHPSQLSISKDFIFGFAKEDIMIFQSFFLFVML